MNITFRQLRLFLALANTGSVRATAAQLHVTQPTVSMQLKEITQAVGLPLYDIVGRRLHLTDAGRELATTARDMLGVWERFEQHIDNRRGLTRGKLRVSVVSTAKYFVPRLLGAFCQRYPHIDIALEVLNRSGVVNRLRDNLDDLYVMSRPPTDMRLNDQHLMPNPLVVIAPAGHSLASQPQPLQALQNERFILREPGSGTRLAVDEWFTQHQFAPRVQLELGSNEAIREAVAGGMGLAILSRHAVLAGQTNNAVVELNIEHFPIPSLWHVVYPASKQLSPIAQAFLQQLLESTAGTSPAAANFSANRPIPSKS